MKYVYDTGIFIDIFRYYYPGRFKGFWKRYDHAIKTGIIVSTREVLRELDAKKDEAGAWAKQNKALFSEPTEFEMSFVAKIFREKNHFRQIVDSKKRLQGGPCADPFIIARAKVEGRCVVTTEKGKKNAARIPNICKAYSIECTNLEGFMEREGWEF